MDWGASIAECVPSVKEAFSESLPYVAEILDHAGPVGPQQAFEAEVLLARWHRQVQERVFGAGYRVLLMPTMSTPLVPADMFASYDDGVGLFEATGLDFALTWPWNLLNRYPVLDVPVGLVAEGMPSGMRVIGQTFTDLDVFQYGSAWSRLRPPLFDDGQFPNSEEFRN